MSGPRCDHAEKHWSVPDLQQKQSVAGSHKLMVAPEPLSPDQKRKVVRTNK